MIFPLIISQIACLQSALSTPAPTTTPTSAALPQRTLEEPASGAVFEMPDAPIASEEPVTLCVTAETAVHLRELPDSNSQVQGFLTAKMEVRKLGEDDGWTLVRAGEQTGYVKSEYLGECQ